MEKRKLIQYKRLIYLIEKYINSNTDKVVSQKFCDEFLDMFYIVQNDLEQEVTQDIYEIFDDLNLLCDSYEPDEKIRGMDKYCIDEAALKSEVIKLYKEIMQL